MIWYLLILLVLSPFIIAAWIAWLVLITIPSAVLRWYGGRR